MKIESTATRPNTPSHGRVDPTRATAHVATVPAVDGALFRGLLSAALIYAVVIGLWIVLA